MPEPLVCEDASLTRLMETVNETPGARILYQDTVRRGGVLGFFAREVHRVAYVAPGQVVELPNLDLPSLDLPGHDLPGLDLTPAAAEADDDLMMLADLLAETPVAPTVPTRTFSFELPEATTPMSVREFTPAPMSVREFTPAPMSVREFTPAPMSVREFTPTPTFEFTSEPTTDTAADPFAALLAEADADEVNVNVGRHRQNDRLDFATILRQHTEQDSPVANEEIPIAAPTLAEVTPINGRGSQARNRLELLVQLRQVGVPVSVNPGTDVQGLYQALEEILDQLPEAATLPNRPGQLLTIVGEAGPALRAARATAKLLRLPAEDIVVAGLDADAAGDLRRINGRRQAARFRQEILESDLPGIVVVATDGGGPEDPWVADLLAALRADLTWAVVDARWKAEDSHGLLDRLGPVQALVVHAAELSASPASVWDLDLPLALLDDRRPSTFVWLSLLSRLFGPTSQTHRATA